MASRSGNRDQLGGSRCSAALSAAVNAGNPSRHAAGRLRGFSELGRLDIVIANPGIMNTVGPTGDEDQAFDSIDVMLTGV